MNNSQFKRVMNLIRRTGDRCVVLDSESEEAYALLNLSDYERLLDGGDSVEDMSEKELMNKVNRDIAYWRSCHDLDDELPKDFFETETEECCSGDEKKECDCAWDTCSECKGGCEEADDELPLVPEDEKLSEVADLPFEEEVGEEAAEPEVESIKIPEFPNQGEIEEFKDSDEDDEETFLLEPV